MASDNRIIWDFFANTRNLEQGLQKVNKGFGNTKEKTGALDKAFGGLKQVAGALGLTFGAMKLVDYAKDALDLAVAAEEVESKFNAVFGSAEEFRDALREWGDMAGVTETDAENLAAMFGNLSQAQGISKEDTEALTVKVAELAGDLGSFNDADPEQVFFDLNKALLTTEREGMKKYGIALSEVDIKQRALEIAIADGRKEASKADRAFASYQIAVEQAGQAVGDLERTSHSTANEQRQLKATMKELQQEIGEELLPAYKDLLEVVVDLTPEIQGLAGAAGDYISDSTRFTGGLKDATDQTKSLTDRTKGAAKAIGNIVWSGLKWNVTTALAARQLETVAHKTGLVAEETKTLNPLIDTATVNAGQYERSTRDLTKAKEDDTEATDDQIESTKTLGEVLADQADPVLGAIHAYENYQQVLQDVDEDGTRTKDEMLKLAEATLKVSEKFDQIDSSNIEDAVSSVGSALGISDDEARDLLDSLGLLDGKRITAEVLVDFMNKIDGKSTRPGQRYAVRALASGGVGAQGEPVLVGERGPEMITPGIQSRITPNHKLGSGTGSAITVNFNGVVGDPAAVAQQIADLLEINGMAP